MDVGPSSPSQLIYAVDLCLSSFNFWFVLCRLICLRLNIPYEVGLLLDLNANKSSKNNNFFIHLGLRGFRYCSGVQFLIAATCYTHTAIGHTRLFDFNILFSYCYLQRALHHQWSSNISKLEFSRKNSKHSHLSKCVYTSIFHTNIYYLICETLKSTSCYFRPQFSYAPVIVWLLYIFFLLFPDVVRPHVWVLYFLCE